MKEVTVHINYKISTGKLREKFQELEENGKLKLPGFMQIMSDITHDQQIFTDCFGKYSLGPRMLLSEFEDFLRKEQHERAEKASDYNVFFREFTLGGGKGTPYMTSMEAVNYLFSKQNQVWDTKYDGVYQNMTRPLSHYWVASSHNT